MTVSQQAYSPWRMPWRVKHLETHVPCLDHVSVAQLAIGWRGVIVEAEEFGAGSRTGCNPWCIREMNRQATTGSSKNIPHRPQMIEMPVREDDPSYTSTADLLEKQLRVTSRVDHYQ